MDFTHFLLTRFNVRKVRKTNVVLNKTNIELTPEWLNHRIGLFQQYCLPSVLSQTNKNFVWIIFYDEKSDKRLLQKIMEWELQLTLAQIPHIFHPCPSLPESSMSENVFNAIKDILSSQPHRHILQSRLDNDDIVHKDYISLIQEKARNIIDSISLSHPSTIDILHGYQFDQKNKVFYERKYKSNQFISVLFPSEFFNKNNTKENQHFSIFSYVHNDAHQFPVYTIDSNRLWIQVIHDRNAHSTIGKIGTNLVPVKVKKLGKILKDFNHIEKW